MASNAPSDGAAGTSAGIGGKFCSRPFRRAAATPYDRPASALRGARELAERRGGGWLAKPVDPASRTITNVASRLFSSVLGRHPPRCSAGRCRRPRAFKVFCAQATQRNKDFKKSPTWNIVECPRQTSNVECGYYILRYMKQLIADPDLLLTKLNGQETYSEDELDEIRSDWVSSAQDLFVS